MSLKIKQLDIYQELSTDQELSNSEPDQISGGLGTIKNSGTHRPGGGVNDFVPLRSGAVVLDLTLLESGAGVLD